MRKWNEYPTRKYSSHDKYQRDNINYNQGVYPSNNFNNLNKLDVVQKYRNNSIRTNNNLDSNNNANIRNNHEINNINSNPNNYVYNIGLGNPDIKKSNEDKYRKRSHYSYDNKKNAGDLYNQKGMNERNNYINKDGINENEVNFQGYRNRALRKFQPTNNKDYRINNRPESSNNQRYHRKYPEHISYDKVSQKKYENEPLMKEVDIKNIRNIQQTKDSNQNQEHIQYKYSYRSNNQIKQKQNNNLNQKEEQIINDEIQKNLQEKNRINNINDKNNLINKRKNQNIGKNFRGDDNNKNNIDNRNKNQINNYGRVGFDFNEKPSDKIFDKDKQFKNKNNGDPIKIKSFKDFDKNEKQKEDYKNQNYLNRNNNLNNNYNILGEPKKSFEEKQKDINQIINKNINNNQDKNNFYRASQYNYSNEINKKIDDNKKENFEKANLDKFINDKKNMNQQQISHDISSKYKKDIGNQGNVVNNPAKRRNFSEEKVNNNKNKPIYQIFADELKNEQNEKRKTVFDYRPRVGRYERNNNNEQILDKYRNNQKDQNLINYEKDNLINTKMVLGKDINQINQKDNKYEYLYDNNDSLTKKIIEPFLNREKNNQENKQPQVNNYINNINKNFSNNNKNNLNNNFMNNMNNNKINSNNNNFMNNMNNNNKFNQNNNNFMNNMNNIINNKNNNNMQLIPNQNNNKNQNFQLQNNFNFNKNNNMNMNNNQFNNQNNINNNINNHIRAKSANNIVVNNQNAHFGMKNNNNFNNNNFNNNNFNNKFNNNQNLWNQNINNNAIMKNNQFINNMPQQFQNNNFNQNNINQNKMNNNFHFNNNQPGFNNNFMQMNNNFQNFNNNVNALSPIKNNFVNNPGFFPNNNFNNFNNNMMNSNSSPNMMQNINNNFIPNNVNGNNKINIFPKANINIPQIIPNQSDHEIIISTPGIGKRRVYPITKKCANGLQNIGATCYMNATLQCLAHVESLTKNLLSKKSQIKSNRYKNQLANSFIEVLENMWENNSITYYAPYNFKNLISKMNPLFEGVQANDSKDLVLFLLETLHNELNKVKNSNPQYEDDIDQYNFEKSFMSFAKYFEKNFQSVISDIFYGMYNSRMMCYNCKIITHNIQCYNLLIIPLEEVRIFKNRIQNYVTIRECFEYYQKPDYMVGQNQIYCNNCKQMANSENNTTLIVGPKILVINLNRGKGLQFNIKIDFDEFINLYDFIYYKNTNFRYKLIGVVTHFGPSSDSGHFIAFCKSFVDFKWYKYNDAMVSPSSFNEAKTTGVPYILFYSAA